MPFRISKLLVLVMLFPLWGCVPASDPLPSSVCSSGEGRSCPCGGEVYSIQECARDGSGWLGCGCPLDPPEEPKLPDPGPCARLDCTPGEPYCVLRYTQDGAGCEDGDPCTVDDVCQAGICAGQARDCSDGESCTLDGCDPVTGWCEHSPLEDEVDCEDGDRCTIGERCLAGVCQAGVTISCEDHDPCTQDPACDPLLGICEHPPAPDGLACDDGNECTDGDQCAAGLCVSGEALECVSDDSCVLRQCQAATGLCVVTGPALDGSPCDDGRFCTVGDHCLGGACAGGAGSPCDDEQPCTTDTCNELGGPSGSCLYEDLDDGHLCDDGLLCTEDERCLGGQCLASSEGCSVAEDPCLVGRCTADEEGCELLALPVVVDCCNGLAASRPTEEPGESCDQGPTLRFQQSSGCDSPLGSCAPLALRDSEAGAVTAGLDLWVRCVDAGLLTVDLRLEHAEGPIGLGLAEVVVEGSSSSWRLVEGLTLTVVADDLELLVGREALLEAIVTEESGAIQRQQLRTVLSAEPVNPAACPQP